MRKYHLVRKWIALNVTFLFFLTTISESSVCSSDPLKVNPVTNEHSRTMNTTIYVDDNNTQGPWDGSLEHPFQFIQDAVNHAVDGDTIFVFAGNYHEHVRVNKSVLLQGEERSKTIIVADKVSTCVFIEANNVSLQEFTLQDSGIEAYHEAGVFLFIIGGSSGHTTIMNNIIQDNDAGIHFISSGSNVIANNIIRNNRYGLFLEYVNFNNITGNVIMNNTVDGIHIEGDSSDNNSISHNFILNNNATGIDMSGYRGGIYDNLIRHSSIGIILYAGKCQILRNNISDTRIGLQIKLAAQCVVEENNFIKNQRDATFLLYFLQRVRLPFIIAPQITNWKGNYWGGHNTGPKVILGRMIISYVLAYWIIQNPGVPWINFDFSPAANPHNYMWESNIGVKG